MAHAKGLLSVYESSVNLFIDISIADADGKKKFAESHKELVAQLSTKTGQQNEARQLLSLASGAIGLVTGVGGLAVAVRSAATLVDLVNAAQTGVGLYDQGKGLKDIAKNLIFPKQEDMKAKTLIATNDQNLSDRIDTVATGLFGLLELFQTSMSLDLNKDLKTIRDDLMALGRTFQVSALCGPPYSEAEMQTWGGSLDLLSTSLTEIAVQFKALETLAEVTESVSVDERRALKSGSETRNAFDWVTKLKHENPKVFNALLLRQTAETRRVEFGKPHDTGIRINDFSWSDKQVKAIAKDSDEDVTIQAHPYTWSREPAVNALQIPDANLAKSCPGTLISNVFIDDHRSVDGGVVKIDATMIPLLKAIGVSDVDTDGPVNWAFASYRGKHADNTWDWSVMLTDNDPSTWDQSRAFMDFCSHYGLVYAIINNTTTNQAFPLDWGMILTSDRDYPYARY